MILKNPADFAVWGPASRAAKGACLRELGLEALLLGGEGGAPRLRAGLGRMRQPLQGSFSAVSKRNFASIYALESSRRDLHDALLCTVLESNPKNQENHGEKGTWSNPGKNGTVL